MVAFKCRVCGADSTHVSNIQPTMRFVSAIQVSDRSLTAELAAAQEVDDPRDGFVWQCQACGNGGHSLEEVLEAA